MSAFWRPDVRPDHEPHKVLIARDVLVDQSRDSRPIKIKVYYPTLHTMGKLPVVFWSHGLGGSVDGASFISRFLASHGYIVVHVQHPGTDSGLWEGKPGHPWDIIRNTHIPRSASLARFDDIPFVLKNLEGWMAQHEEIARHADLTTLGMSGHSFGAMTTQVMCGMMFSDEAGKLRSYRQPIFKAGILYSPVPISHIALDDPRDIYGSIDRPLFFMTGTDDDSPIEGWDYHARLKVYEFAGYPEKDLLILKGGDHMVYNGSRGKLGHNPNRELHEEIIKISALAYWDMMLKGDQSAKEWLTGVAYATYLGEAGTYTHES
jgi:pimeloyl-ACP methyl ester carboxylesterase